MPIDQKVSTIKSEFLALNDWEDRYKKLMEYGSQLTDFPEDKKVEAFKIRGCQSQVWIFPEKQNDRIIFYGDSDAILVKGLVAILIYIYSGSTAEEIKNTSIDFLQEIGIVKNLSMSRTQGLMSMVKQIKLYGAVLGATKD